MNPATLGTQHHAPNAALLIDFDNVTMGIRSELQTELKNLLSSDIVKGKVSVQRAYADWRRYPQYIVPLSESSIDLIFAPAYGSAKKNATDIRLAIDALELVFTRPEIGTFILLSGDSDFSSLVIKLKEYGKYVIGVGIRESSSDLLVQNCDEYYSYNALAGLVKTSEDDQQARKYDPWELVTEAVQRMKRNNDVMRSDRLKQVMQEIDSTFDEKNLGISKFSRFCQEAAQRGLLTVTKLDNGQLEVDIPETGATSTAAAAPAEPRAERPEAGPAAEPAAAEERGGRRGRRGRGGRGRDREERTARSGREAEQTALPEASVAEAPIESAVEPPTLEVEVSHPEPIREPRGPAAAADEAGMNGERLTRAEAFDLVRRTVDDLGNGDEPVRASDVRQRARQLLGRDSESLSERMFIRVLKDAHDQGLIDLRRRGDDFEVSRAVEAAPVSEQLAERERAATTAAEPTTHAPAVAPVRGMGPRGAGAGRPGARGRLAAPPPELLSIGVVETPSTAPSRDGLVAAVAGEPSPADKRPAARGRRATPAKGGRAVAKKSSTRARAKKTTKSPSE